MNKHDAIFNAAYQAGLDAAEKWASDQEEHEPSADLVFAAIDAAFPMILEAAKPKLPPAMKEAPEVMMLYFTPLLSPIQGYQSHQWVNTPGQLKTLAAGLCFATSDDAQTVTDAMLALVRA